MTVSQEQEIADDRRERLIPNKMTGSIDAAYSQGLTDVRCRIVLFG
jgi:hypothetical protein